ncbi:hypothetical protein [Pinisolibacter sp.]|uniref:hypothetical protein n=1 Tax=Pinisolibacter sp. TaxID=2172024 RepID=UPI002FDED595
MSRIGNVRVEAFDETAAWLRGKAEAETWAIPNGALIAERVCAIWHVVAASTKAQETNIVFVFDPSKAESNFEQRR